MRPFHLIMVFPFYLQSVRIVEGAGDVSMSNERLLGKCWLAFCPCVFERYLPHFAYARKAYRSCFITAHVITQLGVTSNMKICKFLQPYWFSWIFHSPWASQGIDINNWCNTLDLRTHGKRNGTPFIVSAVHRFASLCSKFRRYCRPAA